jgi:hypothetical protein
MKKIYFLTIALALVLGITNAQTKHALRKSSVKNANSNDLSGLISGTLAEGTCNLIGDALVDVGQTLTVSPGVKILATGNYRIEIAGDLICNGTEEKPITFTASDEKAAHDSLGISGWWGGILVDSSAMNVNITFTHIDYTGGVDATGGTQASFDVEGSQGYNGGAKIIFEDNWMFGGIDDALHLAGNITCSIKRNVLQRLGSSDGDLINIKTGAHGDIAYNYIWSSANSGIKLNTSKTVPLPETKFNIYNNTIINGNWRKIGELSSAIYIDQNAAGRVYNNIIVGCRNGIHLANNATGADMTNTKYGNNLIYMYYAQVSDSSNAATNNPYIPGSNGVPQTTDKIAYGTTACGTVFTQWSPDITVDKLDNNVPTLAAGSPALNGGTTTGTLFAYTIGSFMPLNKDMGAYPSDGNGNKHMPTTKP